MWISWVEPGRFVFFRARQRVCCILFLRYMMLGVVNLQKKSDYLRAISKRGDAYGGCGGLLDLLCWCEKPNTLLVTMEEARRFYEHPEAPYAKKAERCTKTG